MASEVGLAVISPRRRIWVVFLTIVTLVLIWQPHYRDDLMRWFGDGDAELLESVITVEQFRLANGMDVYVVPNPIVPAVNHMLWFRVGAMDDPPGRSGLAHFFEHMMFRGSKTLEPGEYSRRVAAMGGRENAFTGHDYTAYHAKIAKEHLPEIMRMEADRMRHLVLSESEVLRERDVILEERYQVVESRIERLFGEQLSAITYLHHPYRRPVIGWEHEIAALTAEDAQAFYDRHYHPANAVLVVGGDITAEELRPLAEQYYGTIPVEEVPLRVNWQEPPQLAERRLRMVHEQVREPLFVRRYLAPSALSGDVGHHFPLVVLEYLLGSDKTGLLYRVLVEEEKLATSISVSYSAIRRGMSLFSIAISPAPDVSMEDIENRLEDLLMQVTAHAPNVANVARAKRLLMAGTIYAREGIGKIPYYIGMLASVGLEPDYLLHWEDHIEAVTEVQIQQAAQHVFVDECSVTGILLPEQALHEEAMP